MRILSITAVLCSFLALPCRPGAGQEEPGAEEPSFFERNGEVFGARPDPERGPIGGGKGYARVVTKGDLTARTVDELLEALSRAEAGQVIFVPGDAVLDLTARIYVDKLVLTVPGGVTLAGDRGHRGSPGALLASDALDTPVMVRIQGPDARVTGLRFQGPNPKRCLEHHRRAFGPGGKGRGYYYEFPVSRCIRTGHPRLEVDNCEISGFSHSGVFLSGGEGHRVHHCFIHHCQYNGLGYGVCHDVASSIIEHNLFDWNRHSIAGTGRPGCGYVARHNIECGTSLSHCFDMHGGRDRKDGTEIAGTVIEISNNTFLTPPRRTPVVIRGVPEKECVVHHNWFVRHASPARAVRSPASDRIRVRDNACGSAPPGKR